MKQQFQRRRHHSPVFEGQLEAPERVPSVDIAGGLVSLVLRPKSAWSAKRVPPVPPRPSARVVKMAEERGDQTALINQLMDRVKTLADQVEVLRSRGRSGRSTSRDSRRSRTSRTRRRSPREHRQGRHLHRRSQRDRPGEGIPAASADASVAVPAETKEAGEIPGVPEASPEGRRPVEPSGQ